MQCIGALEGHNDTFVSFRIGEIQKQARLTDSRTFKFNGQPQGPDGFGRVEIFRRVGSAIVSFDSPTRDVKVCCNDHTLQSVNLHFAFEGLRPASPTKVKAAASAELQKRKNAAQEYLDKFGLENVLGDVMREIISQKPQDPFEYLASFFAKRTASGGAVLADKVDSKQAAGQVRDEAPRVEVKGKIEVKTVVKQPALVPFKEYYKEHMLPPPSSALPKNSTMHNLYAKFPAYQRALDQAQGAAAAHPAAGAAAARFGMQPSVGTWLIHRSQAVIPAVTRPAVLASATCPSFVFRPSVGTWLQPRLKEEQQATLGSALAASAAATSGNFARLPSVGTWLQLKPKVLPPVAEHAAEGRAEKPFRLLPSVGTWIMPLQCVDGSTSSSTLPLAVAKASQPQIVPWCQRASVGTWLVKRAAWHRPAFKFVSDVLEKMDKTELVKVIKEELAFKDHEIEVLRAQLDQLRNPKT